MVHADHTRFLGLNVENTILVRLPIIISILMRPKTELNAPYT